MTIEQKPPQKLERIAKTIARAGQCSRREAERWIEDGRVAVNGNVLSSPALNVSESDVITIDGKKIGAAEPTKLWLYHKPVGLVTTHSDPEGRATVFEHLPREIGRVISVGRLDLNSEGLLLLTNDGDLARALELPRTGFIRTYRARAFGRISQKQLDGLKAGMVVEGVRYGPIDAILEHFPKSVKRFSDRKCDQQRNLEPHSDSIRMGNALERDGAANSWISLSLREGKNREIRKVLGALGLSVNRLIRLSYGPFELGNLERGEVIEVSSAKIKKLLEQLANHEAEPVRRESAKNFGQRRRANSRPPK